MVSSALMPPRTFLCTTISRSPRSAALFVGGMFGFSTNRNRSLPALLILPMNFFSSGSSEYLATILLMLASSKTDALSRISRDRFLLTFLASSYTLRKRLNTSYAAALSGLRSWKSFASRIMWGQQRWTRYPLYADQPSHTITPFQFSSVFLRTSAPRLSCITYNAYPVRGSCNIHTQTVRPLRRIDVSSMCSIFALRQLAQK